jgi:acetylglutamate kinase
MKSIVLKISGHEIDDPQFLSALAKTVRNLDKPVVIVHGGGREISHMQQRLGIEPHYENGVRVTDAQSLAIVTMVLCGTVNKRLVRYLLAEGIQAQGMSGVDQALIRARKMPHDSIDMGFTGEVVQVNGALLCSMLESGLTPVIAPICLGEDSEYNVNGDHVAGAVAAAMGAERIIFLSNVEGVLVEENIVPTLSQDQTKSLIADGTIYGGMIPKVEMALDVLQKGVPSAVITNLVGLQSHGGTVFTNINGRTT